MTSVAKNLIAPEIEAGIDPDRYRMLVLDLDGTALSKEGTISDDDVRAARALQDHGVVVTIATGRLYGGTAPHAATLGVGTSVACMNGAEVLSGESGQVEFGNYLPNEIAVLVRDQLASRKLATSLFNSWEIHHGDSSTPYLHYLKTWSEHFKAYDDVYRSPAWERDDRLLAVVSAGPIDDIMKAAEVLGDQVNSERYEILAFPAWPRKDGDEEHGLFMFRDKRENKGTALRRMASNAGIQENEVVCVGDWVNDMPMIESDALSFAMGGSPDWLQAAADHVTHTHKDHSGVIVELAARVWNVKV